MNRRVLVVGYYYPDLNMGGVRMRRICRRLPEHGWDAVVLAHPWDPAGRGPEPVPGVRVEPVAAPDLARIYRSLVRLARLGRDRPQAATGKPEVQDIGLTSLINRWLMIPDKQMPWLRPAVKKGRQLLAAEKFDAIFASHDPRTSLLIAARLSKDSGVPAILEYRDLWVGNPYHHLNQPTALHRWLHVRLERKVIRRASRVSAVCRGIRDYLTGTYGPLLRAPVDLNYNFFDPDEYPPATPRTGPSPFVVSYAGNMYASRTPNRFFEGMQAFISRHQLTPAQFRFRWAGGVTGVSGLSEVLERTQVTPFIEFLGQIPHRDALQLLVDSDAALLLQAPDDTIHIPGKLFESIGAGVPLLALSNPCETADIIRDCRAGVVCPYTTEAVAEALTGFYLQWKGRARWEFDEAARQAHSADAAVAKLARLFDDASGNRPGGPHAP